VALEAEEFPKTHYMGFPASIEPCTVSMCGAGGSPHSVGRGRLDAQLGCASRFSAPGGGANARRVVQESIHLAPLIERVAHA